MVTFPYTVQYILVTYLFYTQQFVCLSFLSLSPVPAGNHQCVLYVCESVSVLLYSFVCFIFQILSLPIAHAQSCLTFCNPMDCSPPGSSGHGIFPVKYWSGLPFPLPGDLSEPGIEPMSLASPALSGGFFTNESPGNPFRFRIQMIPQSI